MTIKTEVKDNLLIAEAANTASTNAAATSMPLASAYGTSLIKRVDALLEPVSSISGKNDSFWYTDTTNVVPSGDAHSDSYIAYPADPGATNALDAFNANYSTTGAVGYVDYVFALQATNTSAANTLNLNMTKCDLTYTGTSDTTGYAYRLALLVQEVSNGAAGTTYGTNFNTLTILGCTNSTVSSEYFGADADNDSEAIIAATGTTHGAVTRYGTAATIGTVGTHETKYFKVTARLWLEGEDTTCNNATYASLTEKWALDLAFELQNQGASSTPVSAITKVARTTYTIDENTAANAAANDVVINGVTYHQFTATGGTIYSTDSVAADTSEWYTINVTTKEIYRVTDTVTVAPVGP